MPLSNDKKNLPITGAAPSVNTLTKVLDKINPSNADVEVALAAQALTLFLDQQLDDSALETDDTPVHPKAVRVLTSGNYTIPQGATAILIEASGGGGGGSGEQVNGGTGGDTSVFNNSAGIDILAPGGFGGDPTGLPIDARAVGNRGGDFLTKSGAAGGATARNAGHEGQRGGTITKFLISDAIAGQTLAINYGAGGAAAGGGTNTSGQSGWVKIKVW